MLQHHGHSDSNEVPRNFEKSDDENNEESNSATKIHPSDAAGNRHYA